MVSLSFSKDYKDQLARRKLRQEANSQLKGEEAIGKVRQAALNLLDRRSYSSVELTRKIAEKGYPLWAVEQVISRFIEVGILDDRAYGQMLMRTRQNERALVGRALAVELHRKGLDEALIEELLAAVNPEMEREIGLEVARRKARSTKTLPREVRLRRIISQLCRKGFSPSTARDIAFSTLEEEV